MPASGSVPFLHAPPAPVERPAPRAGLGGRLAGFLGRTWARLGYAYHVEPTWLTVNRLVLSVRGLAPALAGVRIAQLSDFHCGPHIPPGYLEAAIERTAAEQPDLIALTGDYVDRGPDHVSAAARLFRELRAPLGVFAVLGNHDFAVHTARGTRRHPELHRRVTDALGTEGVVVLRNRSVRVERDGAPLVVAGVDDLWSGESDPGAALAGACADAPRLLLAHNPQSAEFLVGHRADLVLSGHTHGGQINWPGLGRPFLGKIARRWAAGLYPLATGRLYVNTGVGFGWRFRFGVRPELAVFTLQPE
jgi:predicted MPP superfamily phosphohydrolase